jgi:hypothetical protein
MLAPCCEKDLLPIPRQISNFTSELLQPAGVRAVLHSGPLHCTILCGGCPQWRCHAQSVLSAVSKHVVSKHLVGNKHGFAPGPRLLGLHSGCPQSCLPDEVLPRAVGHRVASHPEVPPVLLQCDSKTLTASQAAIKTVCASLNGAHPVQCC